MKSNEAMTLEQYGDKLINEDLSKLVNDNPYFAFIVMSSAGKSPSPRLLGEMVNVCVVTVGSL